MAASQYGCLIEKEGRPLEKPFAWNACSRYVCVFTHADRVQAAAGQASPAHANSDAAAQVYIKSRTVSDT
jgi:hypothetical protein